MKALPMFQLNGVGKSYGMTAALAPLSLTIEQGETIALVGPSGAGKTTLLNILAGLIKPDTGQVKIEGYPPAALPPGPKRSRKVGIMHQQFDLIEQLPVIHNVLAGRLGEWSFFRSLFSLLVPQDVQLARAALSRVGIADKIHLRTSRLSGGEKQRVALARLSVQDPKAFLADEPVSSLDPVRAEDLLVMLTRLAIEENKTLVASLHSPELALRYFSRIIALRNGNIYFDRSASQINSEELAGLYILEKEAIDVESAASGKA